MKAIPLLACMTLLAARAAAQTCPPAGGAAPAEVSAEPPSPADLAQLTAEISSIKRESLAADVAGRLGKIEAGIGAAKTAGDLKNCREALDRLFPPADRSNTAAPSVKKTPPKTPDLSKAEEYFTATNDPAQIGRFYEGTADHPASASPASAESAPGGDGPSSRPSAYDYINAAPSTTHGLHTIEVPASTGESAPSAVSDAWIAKNWTPWLDNYGYKASILPPEILASIHGLPSSGPPPAAAPPPPPADPLSWNYLVSLIKDTAVNENEKLIAKMKTITIKTSDGSDVILLTHIAGYCYAGVKWMLAWVLGISQPALGLPKGGAYLMLGALKDNPQLQMRLHLLPLDLTTFPYESQELPSRTLLIWDKGSKCPFKDYGHIEFTLPVSMIKDLAPTAFYESGKAGPLYKPDPTKISHPVLACSDGCEAHWMGPEDKIRDKNGLKNLLHYASGEAGKCLSAYVPVKDEPAAPDAQPASQTGG